MVSKDPYPTTQFHRWSYQGTMTTPVFANASSSYVVTISTGDGGTASNMFWSRAPRWFEESLREVHEELEKFKAAMLFWAEQRAARVAEAIRLDSRKPTASPSTPVRMLAKERTWFVHRQRCAHRRGRTTYHARDHRRDGGRRSVAQAPQA